MQRASTSRHAGSSSSSSARCSRSRRASSFQTSTPTSPTSAPRRRPRSSQRGLPTTGASRQLPCWLVRAARRGARPLLPTRPGAARPAAGGADGTAGARWRSLALCVALAAEPPDVSLGAHAAPLPAGGPLRRAVPRHPAPPPARFGFDDEVAELSRLEQASAFLALLELRKRNELVHRARTSAFGPIGVRSPRRRKECCMTYVTPASPSRRCRPARADRAHARGAARHLVRDPCRWPISPRPANEDETRVEAALHLVGERYSEGRSGIVLEKVAGGYAFRAARSEAEACARLVERPVERGLSQAALETLAIVAYLGPVHATRRRTTSRRGRGHRRRRARRAGPRRRGRPRARARRRDPLPNDRAVRACLRPRRPLRAADDWTISGPTPTRSARGSTRWPSAGPALAGTVGRHR